MAPKTKASISISVPFDARHVSGANIPGFTNPVAVGGLQRSYTSIQPDTIPTHSFASSGTSEITKPRRASSLASSLSRPSLRLKTSISRLRAHSHSNSNSPDTHRKRSPEHTASVPSSNKEPQHPTIDTSTASLRQNPSMTLLRSRTYNSSPTPQPKSRLELAPHSTPDPAPSPSPPTKSLPLRPPPPPTSKTPLSKPPTIPLTTLTPTHTHTHTHQHQHQHHHPQTTAPPPTQKPSPPTRPTRADSGTAVDFTHLHTQDRRPLGFKEITAVNSFQRRMALYKRTREYWATCDHGLEEWVVKAGSSSGGGGDGGGGSAGGDGGARRTMVSFA